MAAIACADQTARSELGHAHRLPLLLQTLHDARRLALEPRPLLATVAAARHAARARAARATAQKVSSEHGCPANLSVLAKNQLCVGGGEFLVAVSAP